MAKAKENTNPEAWLWSFMNKIESKVDELSPEKRVEFAIKAAKILIDIDNKAAGKSEKTEELDLSHLSKEDLFKILNKAPNKK